MSERFFRVKRENEVYNKYFEWWNNIEPTKQAWKEFKEKVGIEADQFAAYRDLYIVPTKKDLINFENVLCEKDYGGGLKKFKKSSKIQKEWEKLYKEGKIKLTYKPTIAGDFLFTGGRISTRLFHYRTDLYCSVRLEGDYEYETPKGYEAITGSKFYNIIELIKEEGK